MKIVRKLVTIERCDECPFYIFDDNDHIPEHKWGRRWCEKLNQELLPYNIPVECPLPDVTLSAYIVRTKHFELAVMAENIAEVCDKLDKKGIKDYEFILSRSFDVVF